MSSCRQLLEQIGQCQLCAEHLEHGPRPVVIASTSSRLLIIGQAPGRKVHDSGIPWNDPSGRLLPQWLAISDEQFYDPGQISIMPMGFCYPGKGKSGDLPPRPECAPRWHQPLRQAMANPALTLLIGSYSQRYYLAERAYPTLTETVRNYQDYLPDYFPLPHPSPRNRIWLRNNPWFEQQVIPVLREQVAKVLAG